MINQLTKDDNNKAKDEFKKAIKLLPLNAREKVEKAANDLIENEMKNWSRISNLWNFIKKEEKIR